MYLHQPPGRQLGQRGPSQARPPRRYTFGYKAHLRIDRQLAQLLRLRVSQINNCAYCLNLHYEAAPDAGIPRPVIDTLTACWRTDFHNDAARAALAYTEAITRVADATVADDFGARHDALAEHFSREGILEIIGILEVQSVRHLPDQGILRVATMGTAGTLSKLRSDP
jgi:AhpD family alkylhydroperoxidase